MVRVSLGASSGFVTSEPTTDPEGTASVFDSKCWAVKDTCPTGATAISKIGIWINNATEEANIDLGFYSHDAGDDDPNLRQQVTTIAKGTTAGWKTATVNWAVAAGTTYWIAAQLDNTATSTTADFGSGTAPDRISFISAGPPTELPADWGAQSEAVSLYAIFAMVDQAAGPGGGNTGEACNYVF